MIFFLGIVVGLGTGVAFWSTGHTPRFLAAPKIVWWL